MILAALRAKLRARGPIGFATDAGELATACVIIGVHSFALAAAAAAVGVIAVPAIAADLLTRRRHPQCVVEGVECDFVGAGDDGMGRCRKVCWYDLAADQTSCRNAEEPSS